MDKIISSRRYQWENKLSLENRRKLVQWYIEGYAINKIAFTLHLRQPTIQYHLKAAGVYKPNKRPTLWNKDIIMPNRIYTRYLAVNSAQTPVPPRRSHFLQFAEQERRQIELEQKMPKSYAEYVARDQARKAEAKKKFLLAKAEERLKHAFE